MKKNRVIFDTNIWISFLIGKKLASLKTQIAENNITIITSQQLINEITEVTSREKLKKYFPKKSVIELLNLLSVIGEKIEISPTHSICRDKKDNFLLDLIDFSKADFLVTGDKDLLIHNPFKTAKIITASEFEAIISKFD